MTYPSTEAYIARLVIHRYAMLGILDEEGKPLRSMGIVREKVQAAPHPAQGKPSQVSGALCPECGNASVIKKDGCRFCTECGYQGSCG